MRENAIASGAGADRISQGMSRAFGKLVGTAAQIRKGQTVMEVGIDMPLHLPFAKKALHKASCKFPCTFKISVNDRNAVKKAALKKKEVPKKAEAAA